MRYILKLPRNSTLCCLRTFPTKVVKWINHVCIASFLMVIEKGGRKLHSFISQEKEKSQTDNSNGESCAVVPGP